MNKVNEKKILIILFDLKFVFCKKIELKQVYYGVSFRRKKRGGYEKSNGVVWRRELKGEYLIFFFFI